MNERKEEIKGKCQRKDCIHYGEACCARETECDGEEFYNIMPDGEKVRAVKVEEAKSEGKCIYEKICVDLEGCPVTFHDCLVYDNIQQLLSHAKADAIKGERERIIKELAKNYDMSSIHLQRIDWEFLVNIIRDEK